MEMDYASEFEKMQDKVDWFKPTTGMHKVKIVEIGKDYETEFTDRNTGEVTKQQKKLFIIEHDGKAKNWGITKSLSKASLYGQLMLVGKEKGKLEGQTITVFVKNNGVRNEYTIAEAYDTSKPVEVK